MASARGTKTKGGGGKDAEASGASTAASTAASAAAKKRAIGGSAAARGAERGAKAVPGVGRPGGAQSRGAGRATPRGTVVSMTSTEAQNGFGRMLDTVARQSTVFITKHNATQAVVMSVEQYEALTQATTSELDTLTAEFDDLLERMQAPRARAGLRDAFRASPEELSRAAVAAARRDAE